MRPSLWVLGLSFLVLVVPMTRSDKKKNPPKASSLVKAGDVFGTVQRTGDELVLRVPVKQVDERKILENLNWWQQKQLELMRIPDPVQRQQRSVAAVADYQRRQANIFKDGHVDIAVDLAEDAKYRRMTPPDKFDDKGRPVAYTDKELRELRGSDKLAGYPAEAGDVKRGQYVTVTLAHPPKKGKDPAADDNDKDDKKGKKGGGKKKDREDNIQEVPYVVKVVYIHGEPPN